MGGCGHRRAAQPETLCAQCAVTTTARRATAAAEAERRELQQLARRTWGEGWDDRANYFADHALIEPRTPREQADRPTSVRARQNMPLEARLRVRAGAQLGWEEQPPQPPGRSISRRIRQSRKAAADEIAASQLGADPAAEYVRKLIDDVKAGRWA